jgi:hypothetical protein
MLLALEKKKITAKDDELIDVTKRIGHLKPDKKYKYMSVKKFRFYQVFSGIHVKFRFYQVFSGIHVRFRFYQVFIGIHVNLSYIMVLVGFM